MLHLKMSNSYKREYKSRLIESLASSTPLPKLNFNSKVVFIAIAFDKVLSDVQVVSEYISIESKSDRITFSGRGDWAKLTLPWRQGMKAWRSLRLRRKARLHTALTIWLR